MTRRKTLTLDAQAVEIGMAVPQVMAHRLTRMALAGASPSARDRRELYSMGAEKVAAFSECWSAMAMQALLANQRLAVSFMLALWFPWAQPYGGSASKQLGSAMLGILGKGMAPLHRRATANAQRLGRTRRRA